MDYWRYVYRHFWGALCFVCACRKVILPPWIEQALRFVPVSVLGAIVMPMVLMPNKEWDLSFTSPWLVGGLVAFVLGLVRQQPLLTIVGGVVAFFLTKYLIA